MGQTVVAENKPGAGGIVGVDYVAHSAPDGYNMAVMDPAVVINPILQKSMPYDIFKDIVPLSIASSSPEVLVVAPQLGIKTYAELVAYGKANPGKLNYASAGVGTTPHLAAEMWKSRTGIDAVHVPYKGIGALLYRHDEQQSADVVLQHRRRAAVHRRRPRHCARDHRHERSAVYPDLPTVAEAGLPGYDVDLWLGLYGTGGTPPAVLAKLNAAIAKALQDPRPQSRLSPSSA